MRTNRWVERTVCTRLRPAFGASSAASSRTAPDGFSSVVSTVSVNSDSNNHLTGSNSHDRAYQGASCASSR